MRHSISGLFCSVFAEVSLFRVGHVSLAPFPAVCARGVCRLPAASPMAGSDDGDDDADDDPWQNVNPLLAVRRAYLAGIGLICPVQYTAGQRRNKKRKKPSPWQGDLGSTCKQDRWRHSAEAYDRLWNRARGEHPSQRDAKLFRRRFRVPVEVFERLLRRARSCGHKWATTKAKGDRGRGSWSQPLHLKLLAVLRILGRGLDYDTVSMESGLSEPLVANCFRDIVCWLATDVYDDEVKLPSGDELTKALEVFEKLGFPGAVCSVDGVHLAWDACPAEDRALHAGKEGYPTLAFNVCVLHTREIIHVAGPMPGATNDKTQARYDEFILGLKAGTFAPEVRYTLLQQDGSKLVCRGVWAICDNGYHNWRCLMPPIKHGTCCPWSRCLESVRKDVECTFGILKKRFRILRHPLRYRIDGLPGAIFKACCALHNILLRHDGLSTIGHLPTDWRKLSSAQVQADWAAKSMRNRAPCGPGGHHRASATADADVEPPGTHETEDTFDAHRHALITHFVQAFNRDGAHWPRKASDCRKPEEEPEVHSDADTNESAGHSCEEEDFFGEEDEEDF